MEKHEGYAKLSELEKVQFVKDSNDWVLSQLMHRIQGALLLHHNLQGVLKYSMQNYMHSQTFDEARHVEVFNKYLQTRSQDNQTYW